MILNLLAPGRFQRNFRKVIFQLILVIDGWSNSCKIVLKWIPMDLTDGKSTLVQVMAWCLQTTSHYLSQCWPRSLLPYGVTRPQWIDIFCVEMFSISGFPSVAHYCCFVKLMHTTYAKQFWGWARSAPFCMWCMHMGLLAVQLLDCYNILNSLRPIDNAWCHRSGSALALAMACCLMAWCLYLKQC